MTSQSQGEGADTSIGLFELAAILAPHGRQLLLWPLLFALLALGIAFVVPKTYSARTSFLPPSNQQQSGAAAALSALGPLATLAGATSLAKTPAEQYVALMQSTTVSDRMIDRFKLMVVYDETYRIEARKQLAKKVRMLANKKDGLISVEVDDEDPARAAAMANEYVEELRRFSHVLVLTEAQQRRVFFEGHLKATRDELARAQLALQASGFNPEAIKSDPRAAAEGYARLRADLTLAEVRLQALRRRFADSAAEIQQQLAIVEGLRAQLSRLEQSAGRIEGADYVTKFREYRYQETLFDLFARQYELARVDESREAGLIQVIDEAQPPEKKSKPQRALIAAIAWLAALLSLSLFVLLRHFWRARVPTTGSGRSAHTVST